MSGNQTVENFFIAPGLHRPKLTGEAEDIGESWRVARVLGDKRVPNRVDSWGEEWDHDWPTWRNMLVKYLDEMTADGAHRASLPTRGHASSL